MVSAPMPVTRDDIRGWLAESWGLSLSLKGAQLSALSGMQDKMAAHIDAAAELFIPLEDAPSTHIEAGPSGILTTRKETG